MLLSKSALNSLEYRLAVGNASLFALLSCLGAYLSPANLWLTLFPNILFLFGALFIWVQMMRKGWALAPASWFVFGSALFFGLGVIGGGLNANSWATHIYGNSADFSDNFGETGRSWAALVYGDSTEHLLQANLLNSFSTLLILFTAGLLSSVPTGLSGTSAQWLSTFSNRGIRAFRAFSFFSILVVTTRLFYFPDAENLVTRSILAKAYFILPAAFLVAGALFAQLKKIDFSQLAVLFLLQTMNGILLLNKYEILMPIVAFTIGLWASTRSYKLILMMLFLPIAIFWIVNPIVSLGRLHQSYSPAGNTLTQRVEILRDVLAASYFSNGSPSAPESIRKDANPARRMTLPDRVRAVGARFDIASIQGYLIREYNAGRAGQTLNDFWAVLIPRMLWPEKPVITRFGSELNVKYHGNDPTQSNSAIAPTYTGEAYWNYGWTGVILISVYLGACFGLLSRAAINATTQAGDPAYLFVAYPAVVSAVFVESWITATYIGGLALIGLYYFAIKITLSMINRGHQRA